MNWLQQIGPADVALWVWAAGVAWGQLKASRTSLRDQGRRIGSLEERIGRLEIVLGERMAGDGRRDVR